MVITDCSAKVFAPMSETSVPPGSPYAFVIAYDAKCPYCGFVMHETLDPSIPMRNGLQLNPVNRCEHFVAAVIESENDAEGNPKLFKAMVGFNEQKRHKIPYGLQLNPVLHIYGQQQWHDDVYIIANRDGLLSLKTAIENALHSSNRSQAELYVTDGEGYKIKVVLGDDDWLSPFWDNLALPYTEEIASEKGSNVIWPWQIKPDG